MRRLRREGLLWLLWLVQGCSSDGSNPSRDGGGPPVCTKQGECEEAIASSAARHVTGDLKYDDPPPVGGDHNPCWGVWGIHETPLADEHWVHNLEHGGVVLLHHCPDGCAAEIEMLSAFVREHARTVLTEYATMPKRFAFVAWGYRLQSDSLDLAALHAFYAAHFDHGPESLGSNPPVACRR